ncbi:concanavalin A-like lectin/glucanase domain-containing protein [Blyttiomyces helicus]|uniref:Concanavalin A-like lectin/glucanase domain-containing protein n=1 Tax=Blyttiomyces helicus TaxID=388810 RepID=A0A4P9VX48_9FUNG|nr:concanavalin A-like lectin/glucanase domain-containing protein [Blyttiomyces helicus]|eukprot:RKO82850.1 concanavalin A-like lectin/glucanase domain-containing protein [Blyttiomyces helicus]
MSRVSKNDEGKKGIELGLVTPLTPSSREIVGQTTTSAQSNLPTYKGNQKKVVFGGTNSYPSGVSTDEHTYGIEWTHSAVTWSLDGVNVRTFKIGSGDADAESTAGGSPAVQLGPGKHWFPTTPSPVQFSLWDGSLTSGSWAGVNPWTVPNVSIKFSWVNVTCYNDAPVAQWPINQAAFVSNTTTSTAVVSATTTASLNATASSTPVVAASTIVSSTTGPIAATVATAATSTVVSSATGSALATATAAFPAVPPPPNATPSFTNPTSASFESRVPVIASLVAFIVGVAALL